MAGQPVAVLDTALLPTLLGAQVEVRKSNRENARYPLYLSTCCGPLHLNTRAGQDFLLEHAVFRGADTPEPVPEPARADSPENPVSAPEKARKKSRLFTHDEGLGI